MNSIEILNDCGTRFLGFALPMLVQSSLLIVVLFTLDWFIRKRVRAAFRYGLWMLVPIKLLLPPSLALPTGPVYWLPERRPVAVRALARPQAIVPYPEIESGALPVQPVVVSYRPKVRFPGWLMLAWLTGSAGLSLGLARRSRLAFRCTGKALPAPTAPERILDVCRRQLNMRRPVRLKLSTTVMIVLSGALLLPMARA